MPYDKLVSHEAWRGGGQGVGGSQESPWKPPLDAPPRLAQQGGAFFCLVMLLLKL